MNPRRRGPEVDSTDQRHGGQSDFWQAETQRAVAILRALAHRLEDTNEKLRAANEKLRAATKAA